jgi:hypothetical protein
MAGKTTDANLQIYSHLGCIETARRVENGFHRVFFEKKICQKSRQRLPAPSF